MIDPSIENQITHIGNTWFPPATYGLAQKYNLPAPENIIEHRGGVYAQNVENEKLTNLARKIVDNNKDLYMPDSMEGVFALVMGVCSRMPSQDINFFLEIGSGTYRSSSEQAAISAMGNIGYLCFGKHQMGWVASPETVWKFADQTSEGLALHASLAKSWAHHAQKRRESGKFEYYYDEDHRKRNDFSWPYFQD